MSTGDLLTIISIVTTIIIAIIGGIYAIVTNTKKFELSEQYKNELLTWYGKVIFVVSKIQSDCTGKDREDALSQLLALIDIGRFYFPNIDKGDGFGEEQPLAHRGYRHIALDLLVLIHQMGNEMDIGKNRDKIVYWRRHFTSIVFQIVSPKDRIKEVKQYAKIVMPQSMSIEDFISLECEDVMIDAIFEYYR